MDFIPSSSEWAYDTVTQTVWRKFEKAFESVEGIAYYRYPLIRDGGNNPPDLTIIAYGYEPIVVRSVSYNVEDIDEVNTENWKVSGTYIDSPLLAIDDFSASLRAKIDIRREIRNVFQPISIVSLPLISKTSFRQKFGQDVIDRIKSHAVWQDLDIGAYTVLKYPPLDRQKYVLLRALIQSATPLIKASPFPNNTSNKKGEALQILGRQITALDLEQEKVAVQIAPGVQQIKGLAGTGKTVLLAMRAANIHLQFRDRKILFTFHTQSLYNQARSLITQFYAVHGNLSPDWNKIHVRHAWGGAKVPGIYSELSKKQAVIPLDFRAARELNPTVPFQACCRSALQHEIEPSYDYILVDEAQDLPSEFFQILYKLCNDPKPIYYAYDELQNLSAIEVPSAKELFGSLPDGTPRVNLDGEYPGGIEKQIVLQKSYRCPLPVLMLAHAIGLGLNSPKGCVQILRNETSWNSVGYEVISGRLEQGANVNIVRSEENSPNYIRHIYTGEDEIIQIYSFKGHAEEEKKLCELIKNDVEIDHVPPEQIVVISLNPLGSAKILISIQNSLWESGIDSIIPGVHDATNEFGIKGKVTLTHVFRAKGNEAGIIYVINAEQIASYTNEIEARNKAFTAISRSKGWVRILGSGAKMVLVDAELQTIIHNIPNFIFTFPDPGNVRVRTLDTTQTTIRRRTVRQISKSLENLMTADIEAIQEQDVEKLRRIKERLDEALGDDYK